MTRAVFLDRDGVINVDKGYVHRVSDIEFLPGVFQLCRAFRQAGYRILVVTNQAAVARGICTEQDVQALHEWLHSEFVRRGAPLDKVYYCPHHPNVGPPGYRMHCACRKPAPGMILAAQREFDIDLSACILLGDKESDISAGISAGIGMNILLAKTAEQSPTRADTVARSLSDVIQYVHHQLD